jgi:RimJ/RimL family protein N-acetyltransferase
VTFPDLQPTLTGPTLTLRPLRPSDFDDLWRAASDPMIWAQHPEPTRWQAEVFRRFFDSGLACGGALVAQEVSTGAVVGSSRYYQWDASTQAVTVGYTFLVRRLWGGRANAEMKQMMIEHAFGFARTVWFEVGRDNVRSRRAMEKIGATFAGDRVDPPGSAAAPHVLFRMERLGSGGPTWALEPPT